ncbi:MAG: hypothetical protein LLG01_00335 [Planctomycetaceae bacterium]|nr:hypothetical protein [Planctomycetaceae bacterium]
MADQSKNGKTGCLLAVILGVIGIGVGIWGGVSLFTSTLGIVKDMFGQEYVVPGRHVMDLKKPGDYVVWHEYVAKRGDKTYRSSPDLEMNISIKQRETGREVAFHEKAGSSATMETPDRKGVMIGTFAISEPGEYLLEVTTVGQDAQTVVAIGTAPDNQVAQSMAGTACVAFPLAGLALLGALIFGIIAIVRMSTYKKRPPATTPYQYPPPIP